MADASIAAVPYTHAHTQGALCTLIPSIVLGAIQKTGR